MANTKNKTINILFTAVEADPLIKVGGLGDVAYALPHALRLLPPDQTGGYQLDARLVLPCHAAIREKCKELNPIADFKVPLQDGIVSARAAMTEINGLPVYLISGPLIPMDSPVYSNDHHLDGIKFTFFSLACLELARQLNWRPDILHGNDWHTAIALYTLNERKQTDPFYQRTSSVITIHNLPFMGSGTEEELSMFGVKPSGDNRLPEWARFLPLPMALSAADYIIAVSPSYANELLTPEFGCGLENFLYQRKDRLLGIVNGIDMNIWDPATDSSIPVRYSINNLAQRQQNKAHLLSEVGLEPDLNTPLLIMIGRMDHQKGVDLAIDALKQISDLNWKAILLGKGDPQLEKATQQLETEMPNKVRAATRFDMPLARKMYAGGDMILMPSRYEPCGLAQMIAMRYGCVPIARSTGGLRDTILDIKTNPAQGTGFLFDAISSTELADTIRQAIEAYSNPETWLAIQKRCMAQDFSWHRSAIQYAQIYRKLYEK